MAVSSEDNKVGYLASGNATYPIPFYFESASHIKLFVDDVEKVLNTHYSVTGAGLELGGELTVIETPYTGNASVIILRDVPLTQGNSLNDGGPNAAETTEKMFDKLTHIAQQINEKAERAIKMPLSFTALNPQITGDITPGALIQVNGAGDGLEMGESTASFITTLDGKVTAAQAAQTAAETAQGLSETAQAASETAKLASETAKTGAETAQTNAAGSASAAADSASFAQQAADSVLFNDVIFITAGMSPVNVDDFYRGAMLACDCSLGPIVINLPEISTLDLSFPWTVSIKKTDSSGNSITVNRAGTNLIDEGISKTIGSAGSGLTLIPDADPNPDVWTSAEFGAAAGNITTDPFSGDGVQTAFTLSVAPGSKNNTQVYIHGVYQQKNTYSISGVTLTFNEAPLAGVDNIEVNIGTLLPVGTPADETVSEQKFTSGVLAKVNNHYMAMRATKGSLQSIPNNVNTIITGWTTETDSGGSFNPVTGVYTFGEEGWYTVTPRVAMNGSNTALGARAFLYGEINSSGAANIVFSTLPTIGATGYLLFAFTGSTEKYFNTGDTIKFGINQTTGAAQDIIASPENNYLSITRIPGRLP